MDVLNAVLQSPRFLYRHEVEVGDGQVRALDPYELARRMAFLTTGGPADDALRAAARSDALRTDAEITAQVDRLLGQPSARGAAHTYIADWLNIDALPNIERDRAHFDGWNPALGQQMLDETLSVFDELTWNQETSLMHLFDADFTIVSPQLAEFYGLPAPDEAGRVDLPDHPSRGGLFTHGGVLALSGGSEASSVQRGLFFSSVIMCGAEIAEPPADVDATQPTPEAGRSKRDFSEDRVNSPRCGGCHASFEPPTWGLIRYDAVGAYSPVDEAGNEIPEDGYVRFVTGESADYNDPRELGRVLAASDRVRECMVLNMSRYALGRSLARADACSLATIRDHFDESERTYRDLVLAIALSEVFRTVGTETPGAMQ